MRYKYVSECGDHPYFKFLPEEEITVLIDMAARLGYCNSVSLQAAHSDVLKAVGSSGLIDYQVAWSAYCRLADAQIEALPDAGVTRAYARIGLDLVIADVWRETKDRVRYLRQLQLIESAVEQMSEEGEVPILDEVLGITRIALGRASKSNSFVAEFLQAIGRFDDAADAYIEREQDECLTLREHGMVNLRLAECYRGLLHAGTDDSDFVQELLETSVQSTLEYLKDELELVWALRMLDELEQSQ